MCGRYTLTIDKTMIEKRFGAKFYIAQPTYDWSPTYNAAPSQMLPIIRTHATNPHRAREVGLLVGELEALKKSSAANQRPPRDRGREANVLEFIPNSPLPRHRRRLL